MSASIFFWLVLYGTSNLILAVSNRSNLYLGAYISSVAYDSTITIVQSSFTSFR